MKVEEFDKYMNEQIDILRGHVGRFAQRITNEALKLVFKDNSMEVNK